MYQPPYHPGHGGRGPGEDLKGGFASTLAAMVSIILSPPLHFYSEPYVRHLAERSYSPDMVELILIAWMILCWPLTFFAARASILAAMTMAGVYLAYRLI